MLGAVDDVDEFADLEDDLPEAIRISRDADDSSHSSEDQREEKSSHPKHNLFVGLGLAAFKVQTELNRFFEMSIKPEIFSKYLKYDQIENKYPDLIQDRTNKIYTSRHEYI